MTPGGVTALQDSMFHGQIVLVVQATPSTCSSKYMRISMFYQQNVLQSGHRIYQYFYILNNYFACDLHLYFNANC